MTGKSGCPLVSSDELIGNIVQVTAYDLRLRADPQKIVADTLDQRGSPARRDGAEGVPCVAGDKAELGGLDSGRPRHAIPHAGTAKSRVEEKAETQMPVEYLYDKKSDAYCVEISAGDGLRQRSCRVVGPRLRPQQACGLPAAADHSPR